MGNYEIPFTFQRAFRRFNLCIKKRFNLSFHVFQISVFSQMFSRYLKNCSSCCNLLLSSNTDRTPYSEVTGHSDFRVFYVT